MSESRNSRDPLAIVIALVTLVVQIGAWFYWGGKIETRLTTVESRVIGNEARIAETSNKNAAQDVSVAVITTQLATIQSTVDRIDRNIADGNKR